MRTLRATVAQCGSALVALMCAFVVSGAAQGPAAVSIPLWDAQLYLMDEAQVPKQQRLGAFTSGIVFENDTIILAYSVIRNANPTLSRRDSRWSSDPYLLKIVFYDAKTGKVIGGGELPTVPRQTDVFATHAGNLLFRTGNLIGVYDYALRQLASKELDTSKEYEHFYLSISPDGRVVWVRHNSGYASSFQALDADSLAEKAGCSRNQLDHSFSGSDTWITVPTFPDENRLLLSDCRGKWKLLFAATGVANASGPVFVSNDTILISSEHKFLLLRTDGSTSLLDDQPSSMSAESKIAVARSSSKAAVSLAHFSGGVFDGQLRRKKTNIVVYNVQTRNALSSLRIVPDPQFAYDFALSPDGSMLAVMTDSHLRVYRLP